MDTCETVKVKAWGEGQGAFVEINAADFDEKVHDLYIEDEEEEPGHMTVAELKAELEARGITIPHGAKKADLVALLSNSDE